MYPHSATCAPPWAQHARDEHGVVCQQVPSAAHAQNLQTNEQTQTNKHGAREPTATTTACAIPTPTHGRPRRAYLRDVVHAHEDQDGLPGEDCSD